MYKHELPGRHFLILGMGASGRAAAQLLLSFGARVTAVDQKAELLDQDPEIQSLKQQGLHLLPDRLSAVNLSAYYALILSPGISSHHPLRQAAYQENIQQFGEIELGCSLAEHPIIGITGTNGKTTTTLLITHILKAAGRQAYALGNNGIPLTKELFKLANQSIVVLELSSYQLETLTQKSLDIGLLLNITPDHLDRYATFQDYALAKCQIGQCLKNQADFFIEEKAFHQFSPLLNGMKPRLFGYSPACEIYCDLHSVFSSSHYAFELPEKLKGKRSIDLDHLLAAYAVCQHYKIEADNFLHGFQSFIKLPHRMQLIAEHQGIKFYDDSKGTNIDAVMKAVQEMNGKVILIAGGVDKGSSYLPWIKEFEEKVKTICAIGQAAGKIQAEISSSIPVEICSTLQEAVWLAANLAKQGENVLLSPGCSSFDMFKDYVDRGLTFQKAVREYIGKEK
jgi:UDP-N-acetylmuramoylalanine--D-glutamate ligase